MASAASELTWLVRLLEELGIHDLTPINLHCDNRSAIYIAKNPIFHDRTKHIEVDCHFTGDKVMEGLTQLTYLPTKSQLADLFTKALPSPHFNKLLSNLGLVPTPNPSLKGGLDIHLLPAQQEVVRISLSWLLQAVTSCFLLLSFVLCYNMYIYSFLFLCNKIFKDLNTKKTNLFFFSFYVLVSA